MKSPIFVRFFAALVLGLSFAILPQLSWALPAQAAVVPLKEAGPYIPLSDEYASAIVMVPGTHQVLYSFKPDMPRTVASLTKLANALVFTSLKPDWNKIVTLRSMDEVGGGRLRVADGAKLSLQDLLYSAIVASANNAAQAMCRLSGLGAKTFVTRMNQVAANAGAKHTQFFDASGMNAKNVTTARDMALIAERAFAQPDIQSAASTKEYTFAIRNTQKLHVIHNTDALLMKDEDVSIIGGKTGYLNESKYNFAAEIRPLNADGTSDPTKQLIVVVLGAQTMPTSFAAAKHLVTWAWTNHEFTKSLALP